MGQLGYQFGTRCTYTYVYWWSICFSFRTELLCKCINIEGRFLFIFINSILVWWSILIKPIFNIISVFPYLSGISFYAFMKLIFYASNMCRHNLFKNFSIFPKLQDNIQFVHHCPTWQLSNKLFKCNSIYIYIISKS